MRQWIVIAASGRWSRAAVAVVALIAATLSWLDVSLNAGVIAPHGAICKQIANNKHEECASYRVVIFSVIKAAEFLDDHEGLVTAIATVVLAFFTWRLWWSTDKLWDQTRRSVELARDEFNATHRPRMRIRHVWLAEPIQSDKPIKIRVLSVNTGDTPARIIRFDVVVRLVRTDFVRPPPNDPFEGRTPIETEQHLPSGTPCDHGIVDAGQISLDDLNNLGAGRAILNCYAYVEYLNTADTPTTMRTSSQRSFNRRPTGIGSILDGTFPYNGRFQTEYEYQD